MKNDKFEMFLKLTNTKEVFYEDLFSKGMSKNAIDNYLETTLDISSKISILSVYFETKTVNWEYMDLLWKACLVKNK